LDQRGVIVTGIFVDWDLYLVGMPNKAAGREEKARFLAATAPLRTRMAEQSHAEDLKTAQWDLPALLQRIWSESKQSPAERRRLLLELWREYAEMADNETSCTIIIAYIRRHLPAGSPDAYTADELSRARSDAGPRFDPYGP
jgi:hypothetical protein